MTESTQKGQIIFNRRDFLKTTTLAALGILGLKLPGERSAGPESIKSGQVFLDFFDLEPLKKSLLTKNFNGDTLQTTFHKMGVDDPNTINGLRKAEPKNDKDMELLVLQYFSLSFKNHGDQVMGVTQDLANFLGENNTTQKEGYSLSKGITLKTAYDEIGNIVATIDFSTDEAEQIIANSDAGVVNLSLQFGTLQGKLALYKREFVHSLSERNKQPSKATVDDVTTYTHNGETISEEKAREVVDELYRQEVVKLKPEDRFFSYEDGYTNKNTLANLRRLTTLKRKFPNKMFVAAGGNPISGTPDITEARRSLTERGEWPDDLIMVGVQIDRQGFVGPASYGCDIYINEHDLAKLGYGAASSFATPVVTEVISQFINKGLNTLSRIKKALTQTSTLKLFHHKFDRQYRVLDLAAVSDLLTPAKG